MRPLRGAIFVASKIWTKFTKVLGRYSKSALYGVLCAIFMSVIPQLAGCPELA